MTLKCNNQEMIDECNSQTLRRGETHVSVHCTFINLMKEPNEETLIC